MEETPKQDKPADPQPTPATPPAPSSGVVWLDGSDEEEEDTWGRPKSKTPAKPPVANAAAPKTVHRDDPFIPLEQFVNLTGNGPK